MANIIRRPASTPTTQRNDWDPLRVMQDLLRWDPFRQMTPFAGPMTASEDRGMFMPDFDVKETKDSYMFKADLPGIKDSDLDITLSGNTLTISGKREAEHREESDTYYAYERSYGTFSRSFTLPEAADADHIQADLRDGVLKLVLPKRPEMQPRRISVSATSGTGSGGESKKVKA